MALSRCHLVALASFVAIALALIVVGGSISAWCVKVSNRFECQSLFHSNETFSCLFKLLPAGVLLCLSLSLCMFLLLIVMTGKKEYQLVTRLVNVFVLSLAIILIMIVLLQWFHPPSPSSKNILIARIENGSELVFAKITSKDPAYLQALELQRQSIVTSQYNINHGPNLFFASLILLLLTLLAFVILHRVNN